MARRQTSGESRAGRRRLGRGLDSLLSTPVKVDVASESPPPAATPPAAPAPPAASPSPPVETPASGTGSIAMIALGTIGPSPYQPRQEFSEDSLERLAESIRVAGLMQPIIVRPEPGQPGRYQLVAGERRWRAAQKLELDAVPAIVREIDEQSAAEWSLIENLQREDLNPMERAEAFRQLVDRFGLTHEELGQRVGLERSSVSNLLRLNELDEFSKDAVRAGRLSLGHARALLALTNIEARASLAETAVRQGMSVRQLEARIRRHRGDAAGGAAGKTPSPAEPTPRDANVADLERRIGEHLGTKVHLRLGRTKGTGSLTLEFYSLDQFDGLLQRMGLSTGA